MPAHAGSNIIHGKPFFVKDFFQFSFCFSKRIPAPRLGRRANFLAAAAVVVAAAVIVGVGSAAHAAVVAAAAEQNQQDDDPPDITAAEIIVAHKITSEFGF